jgi:hypothetical protein
MTTTGAREAASMTTELVEADSVLARHFTGEERREMMAEDALTWRHVVTLLVSVVSTGVLMMILTVLWVSWMTS